MVFEDRSGGREPSGRIGVDAAEWVRTYVLHNPLDGGGGQAVTSQQLYDQIRAIIGGTNPGPSPRALGSPGGAGSLDRIMPMCDSQMAGMFADSPMVRVNSQENYRPDTYGLGPLLAVPPLVATFSLFNAIEADISFSPRPYAVLPNERMVPDYREFFDVDGTRRYLRHYPEWLRFVQVFVDDIDSRISFNNGSEMVYRVPSGLPANLNNSAFPGIPDMVVPDQKYVLRWYQVPLRYLTSANSYLVKYKGFVNQWTWLNGKLPGSMLYMGCKSVRTYTPPQFLPTNQPLTVDGFTNIMLGSFYSEPLVDLELTFIYTARTVYTSLDEVPAGELPNRNWIAAGHNLLPHPNTRRYFYAHVRTKDPNDFANQPPYYFSIPHAILFQDPDVSGLVVTP